MKTPSWYDAIDTEESPREADRGPQIPLVATIPDESIARPILLSATRASPGQQRGALLVGLTVLAASIATLPFATIAGPPVAGFVLIQQAWMGATDLITAALLFGQF